MKADLKGPLISIMGTPVSSGNRGVLALGTSLVQLFLQSDPDARVVFLVGNKDSKPVRMKVDGKPIHLPVVNYRFSPRSILQEHILWIVFSSLLYRFIPMSALRKRILRYTPWVKCVSESKLVGDIRGGDSFSDIYGIKRFLIGFLPVWSVLLVNYDIILLPQTYGPFKSRLAKRLARLILRRSSTIIARDKRSQKLASELVGASKQVLLSPDVAFAMPSEASEHPVTDPPLVEFLPPDTIGLNVNGLMYNGGYTRRNMFGLKFEYASFLRDLILKLLAEHPGELLLVPHTFAPPHSVESDNEACRRVREALPAPLKGRVRVVVKEYDPHQIKGIIGMCDFFIGSRMHSCIAALSQGVPCVGIAYSPKFRGVFDSVGVADWVVDAGKCEPGDAIERIISLYRKRHEVSECLPRRAGQARQELTDLFNRMVKGEGTDYCSGN